MSTGAVFQLNVISGNTEIIKSYWLSSDTCMPEGIVSGFQAISLVKLASSKRTHILVNLSACAYFCSRELSKDTRHIQCYHYFLFQYCAMFSYYTTVQMRLL